MLASAYRQIVNAVGHKAVLGNERFLAIVVIGFERVVGDASQAGVAGVETGRLLIEVGVRQI